MSEKSRNVDAFPYPFIELLLSLASKQDVLNLLSINKANQAEREWLIQKILLRIGPNNEIEYTENDRILQVSDILPKIRFVLNRTDCVSLHMGKITNFPYSINQKWYPKYTTTVNVGTRIDDIPSKLERIHFNIMDSVGNFLVMVDTLSDILIELGLFFKRKEIFLKVD